MITNEQRARLANTVELERLVFTYQEAVRVARRDCLRENGKLPSDRMVARAAAAALLREASGNQLVREHGLAEVAQMIDGHALAEEGVTA